MNKPDLISPLSWAGTDDESNSKEPSLLAALLVGAIVLAVFTFIALYCPWVLVGILMLFATVCISACVGYLVLIGWDILKSILK
jgi:hypothetical protein